MPYRDPLELDEDAESGEVVTVAAYVTILEAEMSREYLLAHGVKAFSQEAASFNPLLSVAAGGARVLVRAADEGRARSLLDSVARTPSTSPEDDDEEGDVRCPRCEQAYCFHEKAFGNDVQQLAWQSPVLALFVMPFSSRRVRWRCHKCLYVWDDAAAGPRRATPLGADDPRPVFRWRSRRTGAGVVVGLLLMVGVWGLIAAASSPLPIAPLFLALGLIPLAVSVPVGHRTVVDVCSAPHCRAVLPPDAGECPSCHGLICGVIRFAHEHYVEAADFRRELAEGRPALVRKGKTGKKEARRAGSCRR